MCCFSKLEHLAHYKGKNKTQSKQTSTSTHTHTSTNLTTALAEHPAVCSLMSFHCIYFLILFKWNQLFSFLLEHGQFPAKFYYNGLVIPTPKRGAGMFLTPSIHVHFGSAAPTPLIPTLMPSYLQAATVVKTRMKVPLGLRWSFIISFVMDTVPMMSSPLQKK